MTSPVQGDDSSDEGITVSVRLRLGARARPWRRWSKRVVVLVLVLNVSLGMALSVVALRHQADGRARVQLQLTRDMTVANQLSSAVWRSVADGRTDNALNLADLARVSSWGQASEFGSDTMTRSKVAGAAVAFESDGQAVLNDLSRGDHAGAALSAQAMQQQLDILLTTLQAAIDQHLRSSNQASTTADVETVLLIVFAAAMGLLLFHRAVAARISGDLRAANERASAEARFGALVRQSSDLISIVEPDTAIRYQTPSLVRVLGYQAGELASTALVDLVHPDDKLQIIAAHESLLDLAEPHTAGTAVHTTVRMRHRDGRWIHMESAHTDMRSDSAVGGLVITSRDVSERISLQEQLLHNAFHDDLTGLANRALFTDRVEHALSRRTHVDDEIAVVFLDLDDFKSVNDTLGHSIGDELLRIAAQRLVAAVREEDSVARLGGDEFAILFEDFGVDCREDVLGRLLDDLRQPLELGGREVIVRASVGIAYAEPGQDAGTLLANADLAMYGAKAEGKDRLMHFNSNMSQAILARLQLKTQLQHAVAAGQVCAYFQPTVTLATGELSGFEALARWIHPERGVVMPADFIPLAEQTGLIVPIGRQVLRQACQTLARWQHEQPGYGSLTMSVNLSARQLDEPDLVEVVRLELQDSGLQAASLVLEITESMLVQNQARAISQLNDLRRLGVRIAIDDFGTGYSSLSYLEQLPVDIVKIDKSFIDRMEGIQSHVIIETITRLGHALGLQTVAEGIESDEQATALRSMSCEIGQGYLFSHPLPAGQIDRLLAAIPLGSAGWAPSLDRAHLESSASDRSGPRDSVPAA